ncbi:MULTISPECIES: hypothetical protein [Pseudomonas]|uniref:Transcriptional repressor n=1 Tax=Pseudomonas tohonis TaxID=2725477 RepID=A0A6J4E606_9PSED|nr:MULTISPECIES: hypothetical protein [Pseudomonas]UXY55274.1 hypothetical protein N9L84_12105 [Pseudomonas tohonis]BBP82849.1 hypothetical protein PHLH8_24910 [Pseudomonas sp. Pc102]BCG24384.1 hypothetical protein TUM18999_25750 [Pseudomonas tohonis]GJN52258.1 hypothetical protein TUM20286_20100 [Pseudomonas tohonis]
MPMSDHQHLRHLLQEAGLKASLPRLKVLEVLCDASQESGGISTRLLHERLNAAGEPLSLISVRQVLGRMLESGLVVPGGHKGYCLAPSQNAAQWPRSSSVA